MRLYGGPVEKMRTMQNKLRRGMTLALLLAGVILWLLPYTPSQAASALWVTRQGATLQNQPALVYVLTFRGAVTPVLERYLADALRTAEATQAEALILRLDTPGGSVDVTKAITQRMLAASIPIIVYVAPAGAQAGSAGTFLTLAGHVAAMAPGTSIGAASPVGSGGEEIGDTMGAKITNILSADIENLAARRGEAATEWAIAAVQEAAAATSQRALELGVIDYIAVNVEDLLQQMDGLVVMVDGTERTLQTANVAIEFIELSAVEQFLNFVSSPTVASLLLTLGLLGLLVEIRSPGFGVPGILGIVSLLMAFYALGQLDANFTGLALLAVALALFVAEAFTPTFGVLAAGGVVAFLFGGALLFDTPGVPVPWPALISFAAVLGAFTLFVSSKALAIQRRPAYSGSEALLGKIGRVKNAFAAGETGAIFVQGEWWNAQIRSGSLGTGDSARIIGRDGYTLIVEPVRPVQVDVKDMAQSKS
jgi:membrane-bound serine protease (ClpP class)